MIDFDMVASAFIFCMFMAGALAVTVVLLLCGVAPLHAVLWPVLAGVALTLAFDRIAADE